VETASTGSSSPRTCFPGYDTSSSSCPPLVPFGETCAAYYSCDTCLQQARVCCGWCTATLRARAPAGNASSSGSGDSGYAVAGVRGAGLGMGPGCEPVDAMGMPTGPSPFCRAPYMTADLCPASDTPPAEAGTSAGTKAGIAVGVLVTVGAVAGGVFMYYRRAGAFGLGGSSSSYGAKKGGVAGALSGAASAVGSGAQWVAARLQGRSGPEYAGIASGAGSRTTGGMDVGDAYGATTKLTGGGAGGYGAVDRPARATYDPSHVGSSDY
jgi:hypothetical protein